MIETKEKFVPDKLNSSYWWIIDLDNESRHYTSEKANMPLIGYSLKKGHTEPLDKVRFLASKLCFHYSEYLHKSKDINIYLHKLKGIVEIDSATVKSLANPICNIHPKEGFGIYDNTFYTIFETREKGDRFVHWANKLYPYWLAGKDVWQLMPVSQAQQQKNEWLDITKHNNLTTLDKLHSYMIRLKSMNFNNQQIETFYKEFLNLKPYLK
jgi:hypothetical protein